MAQEDQTRRAEHGKSKLARVIHVLSDVAQRVRTQSQGPATIYVRQIMTPNAQTCVASDTLHSAARIMWDTDCGCVPVVDAQGKPTAMITDRDICMAAYTQGGTLAQLPVSSAASRSIFSVRETDTMQTAEKLMQDNRVRRLAVVDKDGRLIGVLSLGDLARYAHSGERNGAVETELLAKTLSAVSSSASPRRLSS